MNELKNEEYTRLRAGREFPEIRAGDSIMIEKLPYVSATTPDIIKGVVIGKQNKASDTSLRILNVRIQLMFLSPNIFCFTYSLISFSRNLQVEYGTPVMRLLTMYSPLIKSIKVLQKAFIHKGKKRVRRAKLYYIQHLHPDNYTVK